MKKPDIEPKLDTGDLEESKNQKEPIRLVSKEGILLGGIWIEVINAPEETRPFWIEDGVVKMEYNRLILERESVKKALAESIASGNEDVFSSLTGSLKMATDEELIDIYIKLQKAFIEHSQNPFELHSINVDLLTDGIAERNLIREGIKPQIRQQPFIFRDSNGRELDSDRDLDYIFVRGRNKAYKLIVGSKKGIASIEIPNELESDKFQPDLNKIEKDPVTDTITIELKDALNGSTPFISVVEIRKGPIDLIQKAKNEEARAQSDRVHRKKETEDQETYQPPTPTSPRKSSESGGYGYTKVSG
jgi:hypothetical protein